MILNNYLPSEYDPFAKFLSSEIDSTNEVDTAKLTFETQCEVAHAVAAFVRWEHQTNCFHSEYLVLCVARALWAIGNEQYARQFIASKTQELNMPRSYTDIALAHTIPLYLWHTLFYSRIIRPFPCWRCLMV